MKKLITVLAVLGIALGVLTLVLALTGCGTGSGLFESSPTEPALPTPPTNVDLGVEFSAVVEGEMFVKDETSVVNGVVIPQGVTLDLTYDGVVIDTALVDHRQTARFDSLVCGYHYGLDHYVTVEGRDEPYSTQHSVPDWAACGG
jgi:hypothetical protein